MQTSSAVSLIFVGAILLYLGVFGLVAPFRFQVTGTENFTTYTEVDPNNHISKTANHIDFLACRAEDAYVYSDKGAGHFGTSWEHNIDIRVVARVTSGYCILWALTNDIDDQKGIIDAHKSELCVYIYCGATTTSLTLDEIYLGVEKGESYALTTNTYYYLTIKRAGQTFTCKVYSDSARTTLLTILSTTLNVNQPSHRYVFASQTYNSGGPDYALDCDIDNLVLEGAPPPDTGSISVMGYAGDAYVQFSAYYIGPSGQGPTVTVPASGYTWSNLAPGTYTVYGTYSSISESQTVTVVAGQTASATLTFSGTPPTDWLKWIKDLLNDPMVKTVFTIGGVGCFGIGFIGLVTGRRKEQPQRLSYY